MKVITREVKKIENLIGSIGENIIGILEIENTDSPEMIEHVKDIIESRIGKKKNEEMKSNITLEDFIDALDFYTKNTDLTVVFGPFNTLKMRQRFDEKNINYRYFKSEDFLNLKRNEDNPKEKNMSEELKIGDVVTLKSEALKEQIIPNQNYMTVSDLRDGLDGQYAECIYFDDLSELQTVSVKVKTLVKVIKKEEE